MSCPPAIPQKTFGLMGERARGAAVLMLCAVAALYLFAVDPATARLVLPCPFHAITGLHCPGCGTLRGLHALLHGDVMGAVGFNPLMVACLPVLTVVFAGRSVRQLRGERVLPVGATLSAGTIRVIGLVICLYWIARNIPYRPFV